MIDVKKLGKVPDRGGWRYVGRQQGRKNRSATTVRIEGPRSKYRTVDPRPARQGSGPTPTRFAIKTCRGLAAKAAEQSSPVSSSQTPKWRDLSPRREKR